MPSCNHHVYRSELLIDYLDEDSDSERFSVIADALDRELNASIIALIEEVADSYRLADKTLNGLINFNEHMIECRLIQSLFENSSSWLNQIKYRKQEQLRQVDSTQLIVSDSQTRKITRQFYITTLGDLKELVEMIRNQSLSE